MEELSLQHKLDLDHHIRQANVWLSNSNEGDNTAALSYAAFELRFSIERLSVYYWATLLDRRVEASDLSDIKSFKSVEHRIYKLAGHQNEINGHFEFMRIVLGAMKIDMPLHTPKIGELSNSWHQCSELCHIAWAMSCSVPEFRKGKFNTLSEISQMLSTQIGSLGWPVLRDAAFSDLRNRFLARKATKDDVIAHIQRTGIWARSEYPDGRPSQFVGEAVVPKMSENG